MKILLQKDLEATLSSAVSKTHLALCSARFRCRVSSTPSALFPQSTRWHSSICVPAENTSWHLFASINPTPCENLPVLLWPAVTSSLILQLIYLLLIPPPLSGFFSNRTCTYSLCTNLKQISRLMKLVFPRPPRLLSNPSQSVFGVLEDLTDSPLDQGVSERFITKLVPHFPSVIIH